MTDVFQRRGYLLLALRGVIDVVLIGYAWAQSAVLWQCLVPLPIYFVFYGFLAFAIRHERFPETIKGSVDRNEPWAYWTVFGLIELMHLAVTAIFGILIWR